MRNLKRLTVVLIYFIVITALSCTLNEYSYFPTLLFSILVIVLLLPQGDMRVLKYISIYVTVCSVLMTSSLLSGIYQFYTLPNLFERLFDDFVESQFWLLLYFYLPLLIMLIVAIFFWEVQFRSNFKRRRN